MSLEYILTAGFVILLAFPYAHLHPRYRPRYGALVFMLYISSLCISVLAKDHHQEFWVLLHVCLVYALSMFFYIKVGVPMPMFEID